MATVTFPELHNNGITTLNGAINGSVTTINLATGGAAALGLDNSTTDAYLTIIDATTWRKNPNTTPETMEIVHVTAVSTDALTVTRGVDGTSGTSFADGSIVELRLPAIVAQRIFDALTDGTDAINVGHLQVGSIADSNYGSVIESASGSNTSGLRISRNSVQTEYLSLGAFSSGLFQYNATNKWFTIDGNADNGIRLQVDSVTALDLNSTLDAIFSGDVDVTSGDLLLQSSTPASASATGTAGTITYDSSYIYICTATDTWKRVAIATW